MTSQPNNFLTLPTFSFNASSGFPEEEDDEDERPRGRGRSASFYAVAPPVTPEVTVEKPTRASKRFRVGTADTIGRRKMMEDVTIVHGRFRDLDDQDLFAVFDGHGGKEAAEYAGAQLASVLAEKLEKELKKLRENPIQTTGEKKDNLKENEKEQGDSETKEQDKKKDSESKSLEEGNQEKQEQNKSQEDSKQTQQPKNNEEPINQTSQQEQKQIMSEREEGTKEAIRQTFLRLNELLIEKKITSGTTACIALIDGKTLYIGNVGDTRAVLYRNGKALRLSVDHKPNLPEEKTRIESVGGFVTPNNRVNGMLAVSRALGDAILQPSVSPEPYISVTHLTPEDKFLILACDGLWDIFSDELAVEIVKEESDPYKACAKLRDRAYNSGCTDNISVEMIYFKHNQ